jgi:lysosomal Pro-X carboxypeptidase
MFRCLTDIGKCAAQPFSMKESIERCRAVWGVTPRPMWATVQWGGRRIQSASNIVFTNGLLDPW